MTTEKLPRNQMKRWKFKQALWWFKNQTITEKCPWNYKIFLDLEVLAENKNSSLGDDNF